MKQTFYTIYVPQNYKLKRKLFDHYIYENEKKRIIVPIEPIIRAVLKSG